MDQRTSERFWAKVDKTDECWEWSGFKRQGYGRIYTNAGNMQAHRLAYEDANGPIPEGAQVDHICFNRACVRPDHLRLVTRAENQQHRSGPTKRNKAGYRGVYWHEAAQKWAACVRHNGRTLHIGLFTTAADAGEAARKKRLELFTHNDVDRS